MQWIQEFFFLCFFVWFSVSLLARNNRRFLTLLSIRFDNFGRDEKTGPRKETFSNRCVCVVVKDPPSQRESLLAHLICLGFAGFDFAAFFSPKESARIFFLFSVVIHGDDFVRSSSLSAEGKSLIEEWNKWNKKGGREIPAGREIITYEKARAYVEKHKLGSGERRR